MANPAPEVELLGPGTRATGPVRQTFALNMIKISGGWEVRKGFGQLAQFDTTLGMIAPSPLVWGYIKHLGSYLMQTNFCHEQIISVHVVAARTGSTLGVPGVSSDRAIEGYAVSVYDITTDDRWEVVLHRHTAQENRATMPMSRVLGTYCSNQSDKYQNWIVATDPAPFWFAELNDVLFLGNADTGPLAYFPAVYPDTRRAQTETAYQHDWAIPLGEDPVIVPLVASVGVATPGYTYLSQSEFPVPTFAVGVLGRLAYAMRDTIYFSDPPGILSGGINATSIAQPNVIKLPTEHTIQAMAELRGTLYVFTECETFLYQPSLDFVISLGQALKLSDTIGCLGPSAVTKSENMLVWVDKNGVHATGGDASIQTISKPIDEFFRRYITNPMTSFYTEAVGGFGHTDLSAGLSQPRTQLSAGSEANLVYHQELHALLVSFPNENTILCFAENEWSIWSTESMAYNDIAAKVATYQHINGPWLLSNGERLFMVGGIDVQEMVDETTDDPIQGDLREDTISRSYYVLEYERGGGVDRNIDDEDYRQVRGAWNLWSYPGETDDFGAIYIGPPERLPPGYILPNNTVGAAEEAYLIPVYAVPGDDATMAWVEIGLELTIDSTNWQPYLNGNVGYEYQIDFELPPERGASAAGWGAPPVVGREMQLYDVVGAGGVPAVVGESIRCYFEGGAAPATWTFWPDLNLTRRHLNPLFWIPVKKIGLFDVVNSMGIYPDYTRNNTPYANDGGANFSYLDVYIWEQSFLARNTAVAGVTLPGKRAEDGACQAVDWCMLLEPLELPETRVSSRGLRVEALSHGVGDTYIKPFLINTWIWGLLNILVARDYKHWVGQILDYSGPQEQAIELAHSKTTVQAKVVNAAGVLVNNVFGAADALWGNANTPSVGNVLAVDEEVNTIPFSIRVKGDSVTFMPFGFITSKAEVLRFQSMTARFRPAGPRRRKGRGQESAVGPLLVPDPPTLDT